MNWKHWKLGAVVSVLLSLFVAGAGLTAGMGWREFIAVFCAACITHFGSFLKDHPVKDISFETTTVTKTVTEEKTKEIK